MEGRLQADFNEGLNNLMENNPERAESDFSEVLKKDSLLWQAYYFRAVARKQLKKFRASLQDLQAVLKLHPDFYEGYVELAKVNYLQNKLPESEQAINKAIKLNKGKATAYYIKGDINLTQQQLKGAIHNYTDCLTVDSLFHNARIKLAILDLITKKNLPSALHHLNQVLAYDSLQKNALLFRSILNYEFDKNQCIRDLTNLISVSPNNLMAYFYRGVYATDLENFSQAFSDFQKIIKVTTTSDNNFAGQQSWLDKKIDIQNAGAYTLTRVYGLPENDGAKIQQAYCYLITGAYDKSITLIDETSNPNREPLATYLKAVAYEHKGEHAQALKFYSIAIGLDNQIADAYKKRAIYEQELKQWEQSIVDLTKVLQLNPESFIIYRIRGVSYFYVNQLTQSISDFTNYLKHDSLNKEVLSYRAFAYQKNNQPLEASLDFAVSGNQQYLDFIDLKKQIDSVLIRPDTVQALYYLSKLTDMVPVFTEGYVQKFKIHMAQQEWDPIKRDILRAVRNSRLDAKKSDHSYLLTLQAMLYSSGRHYDDARKTLDEAIQLDKENALAYLERGKVMLELGRVPKAESDLKQASSLGNQQAKLILSSISKK